MTGRIALKQELQREHARQLQTKELQRHQKNQLGYGGSGQRKVLGREDGVVSASLMTSSSLPSELYTVNNAIIAMVAIFDRYYKKIYVILNWYLNSFYPNTFQWISTVNNLIFYHLPSKLIVYVLSTFIKFIDEVEL